jgi:hypothetical protein
MNWSALDPDCKVWLRIVVAVLSGSTGWTALALGYRIHEVMR